MIHRRIVYLLAVCAALLFQITNNNYLAHLLLTVTVALPILSLALSLPGMLSCRLSLSALQSPLRRGKDGAWQISMENALPLPVARVNLRLEAQNRFTGQRKKYSMSLYGFVRRRPVRRLARADHCGILELRCVKARVWDYLGLFSLRCQMPLPARILVEPVPIDPGPLHIPEGQGTPVERSSAGHTGPGEDYELREYRPGDPLRLVHWKLSTKWDKLIVRQPLETAAPLPLLTFDHFGTPEAADRMLDRLTGLSRALLAVQRPHAVAWLDPSDASLCRRVITCEQDLRECLLAVLSQPCPAQGPSIQERFELPGRGAAVFRVHVTGEEDSHAG